MNLGGEVFEEDSGVRTRGFDFDCLGAWFIRLRGVDVAGGVVLVVADEFWDVDISLVSNNASMLSGSTGIEGTAEGASGSIGKGEESRASDDGLAFLIASDEGGDGFELYVGSNVIDDCAHVVPAEISQYSHGLEFWVYADVGFITDFELEDGVEGAALSGEVIDLVLKLYGARVMGEVGPVHEGDIVLVAGG